MLYQFPHRDRVPSYVPALDGLRTFATIAVLFYHGRILRYPGGLFGVDLFYSLSGFLLTGVIIREFQRSPRPRISDFYRRRAWRLLPALLAMVLGYLLIRLCFFPRFDRAIVEAAAALSGLMNWYRILKWDVGRNLAHLWSLAIEFQFCILWAPFCFAILRKTRSVDALAAGCLILVAAIEIERAILMLSGAKGPRIYNGTDMRLDAFALAGAARAMLSGQTALANRLRQFSERRGAAIASVAIAAHLSLSLKIGVFWDYHAGYIPFFVALTCTAMIVGVTMDAKSILARVFAWTPIRSVGVASYGMYLWHYPILHLGRFGAVSRQEQAMIVALISLALGFLSYHLIEKPFAARAKVAVRPTTSEHPPSDRKSTEAEHPRVANTR